MVNVEDPRGRWRGEGESWSLASWELGGRDGRRRRGDGSMRCGAGRSESSILFVCGFLFPGRCVVPWQRTVFFFFGLFENQKVFKIFRYIKACGTYMKH